MSKASGFDDFWYYNGIANGKEYSNLPGGLRSEVANYNFFKKWFGALPEGSRDKLANETFPGLFDGTAAGNIEQKWGLNPGTIVAWESWEDPVKFYAKQIASGIKDKDTIGHRYTPSHIPQSETNLPSPAKKLSAPLLKPVEGIVNGLKSASIQQMPGGSKVSDPRNIYQGS